MTVESLRAVEFPLIGRYVGRAVSRHRRRVETAAKHKTSIHYVCVCVCVLGTTIYQFSGSAATAWRRIRGKLCDRCRGGIGACPTTKNRTRRVDGRCKVKEISDSCIAAPATVLLYNKNTRVLMRLDWRIVRVVDGLAGIESCGETSVQESPTNCLPTSCDV